jgi:putative flavoprotein involved in K+ transport
MYTKVMELNYWGSSECKKASYDESRREWTVVVQRDGKEIVLKPKQLVVCTKNSSPDVMMVKRAEDRV